MKARSFIHTLNQSFGDLPIGDVESLRLACNRVNTGLKALETFGFDPAASFDPSGPASRQRGFRILTDFVDRIAEGDALGAALQARRMRPDLRRVIDAITAAIDSRLVSQRRDEQRRREQLARAHQKRAA